MLLIDKLFGHPDNYDKAMLLLACIVMFMASTFTAWLGWDSRKAPKAQPSARSLAYVAGGAGLAFVLLLALSIHVGVFR